MQPGDEATECEVLVIGAGPAGASLSFFLAKKGIKTVLIDRKSEIDRPLRCAEYVSAGLASLFDFALPGLSCGIEAMDTYIDYKPVSSISSPGFMLDRPVFLQHLVDAFKKCGGIFLAGTKAVSFEGGRDMPVVTKVIQNSCNKESAISSRIVVGADGPNSLVGRHIGSTNSTFILGLGENIGAKAKEDGRTLVFFAPEIFGGYGWLFPKKGSINLGIGCYIQAGNNAVITIIKKTYADFKRKVFSMELVKMPNGIDGVNVFGGLNQGGKIAGLIPVSGMLEKTVSGNFILAGDAAGLTNPVTGAGIYNAVYSSKVISRVVPEALGNGDYGKLKEISEEFRRTFKKSFERAENKRNRFINGWPSQYRCSSKAFSLHVRNCWVSFKEYWN